MPAGLQDKVLVPCPFCGHQQPEPATAISTNCRACRQYFLVQEALHPPPKATGPGLKLRRLTCFECRSELEVAASAQSTMCKKCSCYIDLSDYRIANAVSKNFKTKGAFVIEPKGYVFNTEALVGDAVIKGRFLGKLTAERSLTIYSKAEIKGTFTAAHLIIPEGNVFGWKEPIRVGSAEIAGELVADLQAAKAVVLKPTARLFGNLTAKRVIMEEGAVWIGRAHVG